MVDAAQATRPEDMAFNQRPLLDNEVYSAEPGIYAYGIGGFRLDDTVVVGSTPRVLTRTPLSQRASKCFISTG